MTLYFHMSISSACFLLIITNNHKTHEKAHAEHMKNVMSRTDLKSVFLFEKKLKTPY